VLLLGDFAVRRDGDTPVLLKPRVQGLLAWLLLHRGVRHPRSRVAGTLWPESSESQARTNLRNLVFRLREALPEVDECLELDGQELVWRESEAIQLDVARFEQLAERASELEPGAPDDLAVLSEAVDLYAGELIPGIQAEWITEHRARLARTFVELVDELAGHHESAGELRRAMALTSRLLVCDPVLEPAHRRLMRLHQRLGDRAGGVRAYHRCVETLHRELGVEPGRATTALYQELARDPRRDSPEVATRSTDLVGREAELRTLDELWRSARAGTPQLVRIHGDAGVGKTRLAREVLAWSRDGKVATGMATCHGGVGGAPLGPVIQWLTSPALAAAQGHLSRVQLAELSRVIPALREQIPGLPAPATLAEGWQRTRFMEALAEGLSAAGPTILLLDDVQWADAETLAVLHALMHRPDPLPVLVVATERRSDFEPSHPWRALCRDLQREGKGTQIELQPLDLEHTLALARCLLGAAPEPALGPRLFAKTEGNPLFVVEYLRAGSLTAEDGSGGSPDGEEVMPPTVQGVIEGRLAALTDSATGLMHALGIAGQATDWEALVRCVDSDEAEATDAIDELWQRGLVVERGSGAYEVSHGLIAEVVRAQLSTPRRRLLHRRVAESLAISGAAPNRVARHFEEAGRSREAVTWYRKAAERERNLWANEDAIASLRRCLDLLDPAEGASEDALATRERLAEVLISTGHNAEAVKVLREAAELLGDADALRRARLFKQVALALAVKDHIGCLRACDAAEAALEASGAGSVAHSRTWVSIQMLRLSSYYWCANVEAMGELAPRITPELLAMATPRDRCAFHQLMTSLNHRQHRYAWSDAVGFHANAARDAACDLADERELAASEFLLGFSQLVGGDVGGSLESLAASNELAIRTGDAWLELRCATYLAMAARRQARAKDMEGHNERARELAGRLGLPGYRAVAQANDAWKALFEGREEDACALARGARALWTEHSPAYPFQWVAIWPLLGALSMGTNRAEHRAEIRDCARVLLDPVQHWLPEDLESVLRQLADDGGWEVLGSAVTRARDHALL
jgi:DNA-binding SARP family transcriptional activator